MKALSEASTLSSRNWIGGAETVPRTTERARIALALQRVSVAYGKRVVIKSATCSFLEGEITAILGPSGCGKSTLLRVLNRTLELTPEAQLQSGTVAFHGSDIHDKSIQPVVIRRRIGLIHQRPVPFPMSILDDVLFGARYHGLLGGAPPEEYARRYLSQAGLWSEVKDRLRERADRLSGGQQQRLCLARTLANQPEVILMDEPCSSLDPAATKQIEELVLALKPRYTFVIVTHNLAQARRVSDHALFMLDGQIIEQGSTTQLFNNPQSQLTRDFVSGQIG
jgi:phosphate transport system ATP-binding protein